MSQHPTVLTRHKTYMLQTFSTQNKGKLIHKYLEINICYIYI